MATSDHKMNEIVGRARRVGWPVESAEGTNSAWAYRITRPDGKRVQIHRSPSDVNWATVVLRQLNANGLLDAAEAEWKAENEAKRQKKLADDKAKADAALAKAAREHDAVTKAAGPYAAPREAEAAWLLTPSPHPETRTVIITPEIAGKLLATINTNNRPKREDRVDEFVAIIYDGEWGVTHQGGAVDWNGILQDGQHRLYAIEKTGQAQAMQFSVGMDPANFTKVDTPMVRRSRDAAYMRGESNVLTLTAAARLIIQFDRHGPDLHLKGSRKKVSLDAIDKGIATMGDPLRNAVARAHRIRKEIKITATALAAAIYLIGRQLPDGDPRVDAFFTDIETGVGFEKNDGVWLLRRYFIRNDSAMGRPSTYATLAYIIKAWNLRSSGRFVTGLVWRSNEMFPATIILPPPADYIQERISV